MNDEGLVFTVGAVVGAIVALWWLREHAAQAKPPCGCHDAAATAAPAVAPERRCCEVF